MNASSHIFISYSRLNKAMAVELRDHLRKAGLTVWMDEDMLVGSELWRKRIVDGMFNAAAIILCLSRAVHNKDAFVYKEILLALEVEKCRPPHSVHVIPVRFDRCRIPDLIESRHCVDYFDGRGMDDVLKAAKLALELPLTEGNQPQDGQAYCERYLERLIELDKSSFLKRGEWISTAFIGLIVLEIGLLQEWAPHSQHAEGFPGWRHPASVMAITASLAAALAAVLMNIFFYGLARRYSESLARRKEQFYLAAGGILTIGMVLIFLLLMPTAQTTVIGGLLERNGYMQIAKALFVLTLELLVLLWPSWFMCVWEFRGMNYSRPALLAINSQQIVIISLIAVMGLGMLQWMALKTLQQIGVNDGWVSIHVIVQAFLMVVLSWSAWWFRVTAEKLETTAPAPPPGLPSSPSAR